MGSAQQPNCIREPVAGAAKDMRRGRGRARLLGIQFCRLPVGERHPWAAQQQQTWAGGWNPSECINFPLSHTTVYTHKKKTDLVSKLKVQRWFMSNFTKWNEDTLRRIASLKKYSMYCKSSSSKVMYTSDQHCKTFSWKSAWLYLNMSISYLFMIQWQIVRILQVALSPLQTMSSGAINDDFYRLYYMKKKNRRKKTNGSFTLAILKMSHTTLL